MSEEFDFVEEKWKQLTAFIRNKDLKAGLWQEIISAYQAPGRSYHNMRHLAALFHFLDEYIAEIKNPAVMGFAIFYHDFVYDTAKRDNELESIVIAEKHLRLLKVKEPVITAVRAFIEATITHKIHSGYEANTDLKFFLDFDLSILGAPWPVYDSYRKNIREEFIQYRKELYMQGRKHAIEQIIEADNIYFTPQFRGRFEQDARENLEKELALLQ